MPSKLFKLQRFEFFAENLAERFVAEHAFRNAFAPKCEIPGRLAKRNTEMPKKYRNLFGGDPEATDTKGQTWAN
jgi:hypothetical protein